MSTVATVSFVFTCVRTTGIASTPPARTSRRRSYDVSAVVHLKYKMSVLEISRTLAEHARGTLDGVDQQTLDEYADWLRWKINEGWDDREPSSDAFSYYDTLVRMMAAEALDLYHMKRRDR